MSDDEKEKWETLKTDIINSIRAVSRYIYKNTINIDSYARYVFEILPRNKGVNFEGYFCVGNYDRALLTIDFEKFSYNDARTYFIREIIRNICYDHNLENQRKIERLTIKDWRFYEVKDREELHRIYSHQEENSQYVYNALYDYRKYWFEDELKILQKILLEEDFRIAVKDRENHMRVPGINWKYGFEQMEFYIDEEVEKQTEIQQ